jgi:integrase/recombinase XerD
MLELQKDFPPDSLSLKTPIPLTQHPACVYLAGLSDNSRRTMAYCLNKIAAILTEGKCDAMTLDWSKLRYHHTAAVRGELSKSFSPVTGNIMLSALRRVLLEAYKLDLMELAVYNKAADLANIKGNSEPTGRSLSKSEIAALMATCEGNSLIDLRDLAIIAVLRGAGLRRSELVKLELGDVNLKQRELLIRKGKGKKTRKVYLPASAIPLVENWLKVRGDAPGALFCRIRRGGHLKLGRMHPDAIWRMLQNRAKLAEIESFSPHDLRRTFCGDLLEAGVDLVTVQKLAGHASPATTAQYDRRGEETKRRAVDNLGF